VSPDDLPEIDPERVVIRDKRRIDPETGQARRPSPGWTLPDAADAVSPEALEAESAPNDELVAQLAERTADLQRLQAEFANYRKRIERDRETIGELDAKEPESLSPTFNRRKTIFNLTIRRNGVAALRSDRNDRAKLLINVDENSAAKSVGVAPNG